MASTASASSRSIRSRVTPDLSLQCPQLRGSLDRGHLGEPRRSVMAEQAGDRCPQAHGTGGSWLRGVAGTPRLPRASRCIAPGRCAADRPGRLRQEQLDERRLPDPGLAGHEEDLSAPLAACSRHARSSTQLSVAADDQGTGLGRAGGRADGMESGMHAGGKAVAAAMPRLDEARAPGVVGKRPPQLLDARRQRRIADDGVAPHGLEQLLSGDQLPARAMSTARTAAARGVGRPRAGRPTAARSRIEAVLVEANFVSHRRSGEDAPSRFSEESHRSLETSDSGIPTLPQVGRDSGVDDRLDKEGRNATGFAVAIALFVLGAPGPHRRWRSRGPGVGRGRHARRQGAGREEGRELPAGPLFWRVESFATLAQAQAAAGPMSLAAESNGKAWLFTLGPAGGRRLAARGWRR